MANVHTVSNQVQATTLNDQDLFLISQTQNKYNTAWKSRKITKHDIANSFEKQFRDENFKEELDTLQEIFSEFVDGRELSIEYDSTSKKIHLFDGNNVNSEIDASDFIYDGMIESVEFKNPYLVIKFKTSSGVKSVQIDISQIAVLSAGYGIEISNRNISLKDHQHLLSSIADVNNLSNTYSLIGHSHDQKYQKIGDYLSSNALEGYSTQKWVEDKNYLTQHQSLSNYYDKNKVNDELKKYQLSGDYLSSNALDKISVNWQNTYDCVKSMSVEWRKGTTYKAGDGIKIENNTISLSAELNSKVTFRDWNWI